VLVHLGTENYLPRYKIYIAHVQQWRQQFEKLESVDLRYDGQIIVNPDLKGIAHSPALATVAAKPGTAPAVNGAVKPAAKTQSSRAAAKATWQSRKKLAAKRSQRPAASKAPAVGQTTAKIPAQPGTTPAVPSKTSQPSTSVKVTSDLDKSPATATTKAAPTFGPPAVAAPASVNTSQKKPSPAIPKERTQQQ